MSGELKDRLTIILHSGAYDRVHYALSLATIALAMGMEVSILFTYGALKRLIKGRTDRLFDDLDIDQDVRAGVEAGRIKPISEVLKDAKESGLQVYACSAAMAAYGVRQEDLIEEVDGVASLFTVIDQAREGAVTLYI